MVKETVFVNQYIARNIELARMLTIHSTTSANLINEFLINKHGETAVDVNNKLTWKYYLNISGEYHPTDTIMKVISIDTQEEITFSKQTLSEHTGTLESYKYGTRYYNNIVQVYPEQEMLIRGILYPADINKAINSEDGDILSYPKHLVEDNEETLIKDLQEYIKNYNLRWNVKALSITNSLYHSSQHAILYLNILPKLLNFRLLRCKTNEVHSFHLKEYLASHGNLDRFIPYMTLKQQLWLYRNIRYIERNSGKVHQFNTLIEHLFTERFIPVSEFSVRHVNEFDERGFPEILVRRKPLNLEFNRVEKDYISLPKLYQKETPIAYNNDIYFIEREKQITKSFKYSDSSVLQTKDLESAMIDYSDSVPDPLNEVLLRLLAFTTLTDLKKGVVVYKDIFSGENKTLTSKDAFIYMYYLNTKAINIDIEYMPPFIDLKVPRYPKPSVQDLLSMVDTVQYPELFEVATLLVNSQPEVKPTFSASVFFEIGYGFYNNHLKQWYLISNTEDMYKRAQVSNMVDRLYVDRYLEVSTGGLNMTDWLKSKNLPEYNYNHDDAIAQATNIFNASVGLNIDSTKLMKNIQKAMVKCFLQLSSYTIQFILDINDSRIIPLNWGSIRVGEIKKYGEHNFFVPVPLLITDFTTYSERNTDLSLILDHGCSSVVIKNEINVDVLLPDVTVNYMEDDKCINLYNGLGVIAIDIENL